MRYCVAVSSGLEPGGARLEVRSVESLYGRFRIAGKCMPWWVGPPQDAALSAGDSVARVEAVEIGFDGSFAVEAAGEPQAGDTIHLGLGEAWVIMQVFQDT